jgi:pantetheine-phosphate adenylyltransferase
LKIAVYPGSFDPMTLGHQDIIERISKIYDRVIVLVSVSEQKSSLFSVEERMHLIKKSLAKIKNVQVDSHQGLTVDYVKKAKAQVIVRGLRAVVDFEYELTMANMNRKLNPQIETVLVFASPEYYFISSRGVKEVAKNGGSLKGLVSSMVGGQLKKKLGAML